MPERRLPRLRKALLDAGIAPKFASRVDRELKDHLEDLRLEALERGRTHEDAEREACRRLGTDRAIIGAFLAMPELLHWVYRARWLERLLRTVVGGYLAIRRTARRAAGSAVARYAVASGAATVLTLSLLFALQLTIRLSGLQDPAAPGSSRAVYPISLDSAAGARATAPAAAAGEAAVAAALDSSRRPANPRPTPLNISTAVTPPLERTAPNLSDAPRIAGMSPPISDGEFLPIVKVSPIYPPRAAARGLEGYVVIEYTVTRSGTVSDVVVIESSSPLFEQSALEAALKFKYKPRVIDGRSVAVTGVRTIIRFRLEA